MARFGRLIIASVAIAALALGPAVAAQGSVMPMHAMPAMCGEMGDGPCDCQPNDMKSNFADCMLQCGVTIAIKTETPFVQISIVISPQIVMPGDTLMPFFAGAPPSPPPRSSVLI